MDDLNTYKTTYQQMVQLSSGLHELCVGPPSTCWLLPAVACRDTISDRDRTWDGRRAATLSARYLLVRLQHAVNKEIPRILTTSSCFRFAAAPSTFSVELAEM